MTSLVFPFTRVTVKESLPGWGAGISPVTVSVPIVSVVVKTVSVPAGTVVTGFGGFVV